MRSIVIDGTRAARVGAAGGVGVGVARRRKNKIPKNAREPPTGLQAQAAYLKPRGRATAGLPLRSCPGHKPAEADDARRYLTAQQQQRHTQRQPSLSRSFLRGPLLSRPLLLLLRRCWCSLCARCLLACSLALTLPGLLLLLLVRCCSAVFDVAVVDAAKHLLCCSVFWLCSCVCRRDSRHLLALVLMARISPPTRSRLATP